MRLSTLATILTLALLPAAAQVPQFNGATPLEWSTRLAKSEQARYGDRLMFGGSSERAR